MNHSLFIQFTHEIKNLNSKELLSSAKTAAKREQNETLNVLAHLYEIDRRRLYAELEYSSLWAYAVGELGYSSSSAAERCESMRLMYSSPLATEKIESGELNLTNALQLQRHFKNLETPATTEEKEALIKNACGKSTREVAFDLLKQDPHALPQKEKQKQLTEEFSTVSFLIDEETKEMLERVKELKGPQTKLQEIFKMTLKHYLEKNDPLMKAKKASEKATEKAAAKNSAFENTSEEKSDSKTTRAQERSSENTRYRAKNIENAIQLRAEGQCEYIAENGNRCQCRTRLEYDHIIPFAMGGASTFENLRLVCSAHNKHYAIQEYGKEKMGKYFKVG